MSKRTLLLTCGAALCLVACYAKTTSLGSATDEGVDKGVDAGSTFDASSGDATVDAGDAATDGSAPEEGLTQCFVWNGTCRAAAIDLNCHADEVSAGAGFGCEPAQVCCLPRCYPANPGCPPGMVPSPTTDAMCTGGTLACIKAPPTCASVGGTCETLLPGDTPCDGFPVLSAACTASTVCCGNKL